MFKTILSTVLLLIAMTFSFNALALPAEGLLGRWKAVENLRGANVTFLLAFRFQETKTTMTVTCLYPDGASLETNAAAWTDYSDNEIYIREKRQSVVDDGFHFCRATLQPARWTAYFDGTGQMILFVNVPYQSRLTLIRDDI